MSERFRGYMPVVIDVETAGFNAETDALLEIAAVLLRFDEENLLGIDEIVNHHIQPFEGANLDQDALEFTGIQVDHPFRKQIALSERKAIKDIFRVVRDKLEEHQCTRAVLVGHNAAFDISFLNAAVARCKIKDNPFHRFTTFDTATLAGLAYGQTVLSYSVAMAGLTWDSSQAHSAHYDADMTAQLFCSIVNIWAKKRTNKIEKFTPENQLF